MGKSAIYLCFVHHDVVALRVIHERFYNVHAHFVAFNSRGSNGIMNRRQGKEKPTQHRIAIWNLNDKTSSLPKFQPNWTRVAQSEAHGSHKIFDATNIDAKRDRLGLSPAGRGTTVLARTALDDVISEDSSILCHASSCLVRTNNFSQIDGISHLEQKVSEKRDYAICFT